MKYFTLGLDRYFEMDEEGIFYYEFQKDKLITRRTISENVAALGQEVPHWQYRKEIDNRIYYFGKKFK